MVLSEAASGVGVADEGGCALELEVEEVEEGAAGCLGFGSSRRCGVLERCLRAVHWGRVAGFAEPGFRKADCHRNGSRRLESFAPDMLIVERSG